MSVPSGNWAVIWFLFPISSLKFLPSPLPLFVLSFFCYGPFPLLFWFLFDLEGKTFLSMSHMFRCHSFVGRLFYSQVDEPS